MVSANTVRRRNHRYRPCLSAAAQNRLLLWTQTWQAWYRLLQTSSLSAESSLNHCSKFGLVHHQLRQASCPDQARSHLRTYWAHTPTHSMLTTNVIDTTKHLNSTRNRRILLLKRPFQIIGYYDLGRLPPKTLHMCPFPLFVALCYHNPPTTLQTDGHCASSISATCCAIQQSSYSLTKTVHFRKHKNWIE